MLARALFRRRLFTRAVGGSLAAALFPALILATAVGAPLGGALGRQLFRDLGLPGSGDMLGIASGAALVLALVILAGGAVGLALAHAIELYRR